MSEPKPRVAVVTGASAGVGKEAARVLASQGWQVIGTGRDPWPIPERLRARFNALSIAVDAMTTGAAVRTYNILLAENRRVGAGLIAVD